MLNQQRFFLALGKRVREFRKRRGYSQEDMIAFGFSARHWQQIEAGRPITVSTLLRICHVFNIPPEYLVREMDTIPGPSVPQRHEVQFYSEDGAFLESFMAFIATALRAGNSAIAMATKSHLSLLLQRLKIQGMDMDDAIRAGTYIELDATDTLKKIMVGGSPDGVKFLEGCRSLIEKATKATKSETPRVAFCGECVGLLCAAGNANAAIQLEKSGNELMKTHSIDILCAYPISGFRVDKDKLAFRNICAEHSAVHFR